MNIADLRLRSKSALVLAVTVLAAFVGFGCGVLAGRDSAHSPLVESVLAGAEASEPVVASANGRVYYFPWCAGADRIGAANKVWFESMADAESHGYAPAKGCGGL